MQPGPAKLSLCYSSGLTVEALEGDVVPVDVTLERRLVREDEAALLARHLQQQKQEIWSETIKQRGTIALPIVEPFYRT